MSETPTRPRQARNSERTRRAVLDAATRLMSEHGTAVSLADVAAEAGVSKSGLLHHFPTREQLVLEVVLDAAARFRAFVGEYIDLSENTPGKMLRAYVRALCTLNREFSAYFGSSPLWNGLHRFPEINELLDEDSRRWDEQLLADGLDPIRVHVIRRAAEGMAAASSYGDEQPERVECVRDVLLAMTEERGPIVTA